MLLCSGKNDFLKLSASMGEYRGGDWKNIITHAIFTSNPAFISTKFWPKDLKRLLAMLIHLSSSTSG
jgi:hypothetical protein